MTASNCSYLSKYYRCEFSYRNSSKRNKKKILFTTKDIKPDAIKIGMLHSAKVITSVCKALDKIQKQKR